MATKLYSGSLTLAALEAMAQQDEEIIGPVATISISGTETAFTYRVAQSAGEMPSKQFSLATFTDAPPSKPGMTVFLVGRGLVEGKDVRIAAYR